MGIISKPSKELRQKYNVDIQGDSLFASHARLLQSIWRGKSNIPMGSYLNREGKSILLGNYIEKEKAFEKGYNFLTDKIRSVVESTLKNKETGAQIEENRLYTNLLSSQPLAFNLFAELSLDLDKATVFFRKHFNNQIKDITNIIFEHSEGRGNNEYTGDHSAFDVFVEYVSDQNRKGFTGIEVKYAENLRNTPAKTKEKYVEITAESNIFKPYSLDSLQQKPIEQIWRDHLLAIAHIKHPGNEYTEGLFIYLFPKNNMECQNAVSKYKNYLVSDDESVTCFGVRYLDDIMLSLHELYNSNWTKELIARYQVL